MIGKKKKVVKEEAKKEEPKKEVPKKKNPYAPGTSKYQQWETLNS